jgi:hypothetical protein
VSISQSVEQFSDSFGSQIFIVHTFTTFVDVPAYTQVRSSLTQLSPDSAAGKRPLGADVIIGIVIGVGAAIALFAGMIVFVFRSCYNKSGNDGSNSSAERDRASVLITPERVNRTPDEPPTDKPADTEAIDSLNTLIITGIEDQPPIWI